MRRPVSDILIAVVLAAALVAAALPAFSAAPASAAAAPLRVAIVRSAMTESAYKADGSANGSHARRVGIIQNLLSDSKNGMSVTIIGDGDLSNIDTLRGYDVVVLVRNVATIESQRLALRRYVAEGGGLVSMFSTSRYDFRPGQRSPYGGSGYSSYGTPYFQFNFAWGFSGSSFLSQSFEYGELSELIATKFTNDPLFQPNYQLVGSGASHPILQMTAADLGTTKISFSDPNPQYNETVWPIKSAPITTLLNYSGERVGGNKVGIESATTRYGAASHMAAWALPYYYGKVAAYGFQIYDLTSQPAAARMVVNSVKWAGSHDTFGNIRKAPDVTVNAWYTRGQIWATAAVANKGSIQLRGRLRADYYRPGASTPFTGAWIKDPQGYVPVSPGESYKDTSGANPSVNPSGGRWRVRVSYSYYDYFRGGWVSVYRDGYLDGTGSGMIWRGQSALVGPTTALGAPAGSTQLAGADRYGTAAAVSKAGWPSVDATTNAVILASGWNYSDALAAAPLAGKLHAPILLAHPNSLPTSVADELKRLYASSETSSPAKLYVVSSLAPSVIAAAESAIANAGQGGRSVETSRLAGADRNATAHNIAEVTGPSAVNGFTDTAFIVTEGNYADALSVAPVAARLQVPILFVGSTVSATTQNTLDDLGIKHSIIIGSTAAVSGSVETWLEQNGHRAAADPRLEGGTRYDTCLRVMDYAKLHGFSDNALYIATGVNYPDALAIGPLAGSLGRPVLLVNGSDIAYSPASAGYLSTRREARPPVTFVGGTPAVAAYVRGQIKVALTP